MSEHSTALHDATSITVTKDTDSLLAALAVVDREGWEGPAACQLLEFVSVSVIPQLAWSSGARGPAFDQACASAWQMAWQVLADRRTREADSPWGVVNVAVRRAIWAEQIAARYGVTARNGWRINKAVAAGDAPPIRLVSITELIDAGWDSPPTTVYESMLGPQLTTLVGALVAVGWTHHSAVDAVVCIAETHYPGGTTEHYMVGARCTAARLQMPLWQVRRLMYVVLGAPNWPGVVQRLIQEGDQCLEDAGVQAALLSTVRRHHPAPILAASKALARAA